jgi:hypothetical protein
MTAPRRSSSDFVVRALTISVSVLIVVSGLSLIIVELFYPAQDTSGAVRGIGDIINTVVGALIGYLAGRAPGVRAARKDDEPSD